MCLQGSCKAGPTVYFKNRRFKVDGSSISIFFFLATKVVYFSPRTDILPSMWFGEAAGKGKGELFLHSSKELDRDCTNNTPSNVSFQSVCVNFETPGQGTMWKLSCTLFFFVSILPFSALHHYISV